MSSAFTTNRREFLLAASAAMAASSVRTQMLAQATAPRSAADSPEVSNGRTTPLLQGATARPMRYKPHNGAFVIHQGKEFFNRPLYGPNNAFRVDAGDLPEFSLYLPGHGGNLKFALRRGNVVVGLADADAVTATYIAGRMQYLVSDARLGKVEFLLELCTAAEGAGLWAMAQAHGDVDQLELLWAFGGASGRKGKRGGDIGCENRPVSEFFQLQPLECRENKYVLQQDVAQLNSPAVAYQMQFPQGSRLAQANADKWHATWQELFAAESLQPELPVLIGSAILKKNAPAYFLIEQGTNNAAQTKPHESLPVRFEARIAELDAIASSVTIRTPDAHVNCLLPALNIAANALWDAQQGCVMHGAVAWRNPLAGWRGPYVLDALGGHARFQTHARRWLGRQNTQPVAGPNPAVGEPDAGSHLARSENLLHSNGDLSHNHYDMNLVFFDALLRHLKWTGDTAFAAEAWPALERHLAWEQRLFRRAFHKDKDKDKDELPLYEAYACIWASDNLQYNGAGVAHSSAYNYIAHRWTAELARSLKKDSAAYEAESNKIHAAMNQLLWLPQQGCMGEAKDLLGPQSVYSSPALWTVYHVIDSEAVTRKQAWQMLDERLHALEPVPVHGPGVPEGNWYMLSCSDWLPYIWSLNLLLLAENMHFALALWQAGRSEDAWRIFKGSMLDSMFMGLTPGNFHMTSALDVHRQEAQRDFGDPIGATSRALIEGIFGIRPNMLAGELQIEPGFPAEWRHASIEHPDLSLQWSIENGVERYSIRSRFKKPPMLRLTSRAHSTRLPEGTINGFRTQIAWEEEAVGCPLIKLQCASAFEWLIELRWSEEAAVEPPAPQSCRMGDVLRLPAGVAQVEDPQNVLQNGMVNAAGHHLVFVRMQKNDCRWWMPVSFHVEQAHPVVTLTAQGKTEMVDLSAVLNQSVAHIFERIHAQPRSPYCSLSIPEQGYGGWAAFNLQPKIDDTGLRSAGGRLQTPAGIPFATPAGPLQANCRFLSWWSQDERSIEIPLSGKASAVHLLMTGTTNPQASRMEHGVVTVQYAEGGSARLSLRNPETWWPIEQDYLLDDYLFINRAPLPVRVDLKTGHARQLADFKGKGGMIDGGAATVLSLPLDSARDLHSLRVESTLYGVVLALLAVTLDRA